MSVPHRDDALPTVARCPRDDDESAVEIACRDVPRLAIDAPVIEAGEVIAGKYPLRIGEIQAALGQSPASLRFIPSGRHLMYIH
jgi:hypothetical protein